MNAIMTDRKDYLRWILFVPLILLEAVFHLKLTIWPVSFMEHSDAILNIACTGVVLLCIWLEKERLDSIDWKENRNRLWLCLLAILSILLWNSLDPYYLTAMLMMVSWHFMTDERQFRIRVFVHFSLFFATVSSAITGILPYNITTYDSMNVYSGSAIGYRSLGAFICVAAAIIYAMYLGGILDRMIIIRMICMFFVIEVIGIVFHNKLNIIITAVKYNEGYPRCILVLILMILSGIACSSLILFLQKQNWLESRIKNRKMAAGIALVIFFLLLKIASSVYGEKYNWIRVYEDRTEALRSITDINEYLDCIHTDYMTDEYDIMIAVCDTLENGIDESVMGKLNMIGAKKQLAGYYRNAYVAILENGNTIYEALEEEKNIQLSYKTRIKGADIRLQSMPYYAGGMARIFIDGKDYAVNGRGLNIVVYNNVLQRVIDSVSFDTASDNGYITAVRFNKQ